VRATAKAKSGCDAGTCRFLLPFRFGAGDREARADHQHSEPDRPRCSGGEALERDPFVRPAGTQNIVRAVLRNPPRGAFVPLRREAGF
jgi:hypothetical protein